MHSNVVSCVKVFYFPDCDATGVMPLTHVDVMHLHHGGVTFERQMHACVYALLFFVHSRFKSTRMRTYENNWQSTQEANNDVELADFQLWLVYRCGASDFRLAI